AGGWSVAMVLEHLAQTERGVARLLGALASEAAPRDAADDALDAFAQHVDMPRFLDRSRKIRGAQPSGTMSAADGWAALGESRRALLAALGAAAGRRLEDVAR